MAYVCLIQAKIYIHIQNTTSPQNVYAWRHVAQRMYMYNKSFRQDGHIHEVKLENMKNMDKIGIQVKCMNHQN